MCIECVHHRYSIGANPAGVRRTLACMGTRVSHPVGVFPSQPRRSPQAALVAKYLRLKAFGVPRPHQELELPIRVDVCHGVHGHHFEAAWGLRRLQISGICWLSAGLVGQHDDERMVFRLVVGEICSQVGMRSLQHHLRFAVSIQVNGVHRIDLGLDRELGCTLQHPGDGRSLFRGRRSRVQWNGAYRPRRATAKPPWQSRSVRPPSLFDQAREVGFRLLDVAHLHDLRLVWSGLLIKARESDQAVPPGPLNRERDATPVDSRGFFAWPWPSGAQDDVTGESHGSYSNAFESSWCAALDADLEHPHLPESLNLLKLFAIRWRRAELAASNRGQACPIESARMTTWR
jgi:hypothetical protein